MKKKIALVLAAMMAVGSMGMASFAEETEAQVTELNWEAVEPILEAIGIEGDFVTFDEVAVKMWLPAILDEVELTDEDNEAGYIGYYETGEDAESEAAVSVVYVDLGGMELSEYAEKVAEEDGVSDVEMATVNGLPCVTYELKDQDSGVLAFMTEAGYGLEITCSPVSTEEAQSMLAFILSSIMPTEEAAETEA